MMMLRATGFFLVVLGIIWFLQGLGLIAWPADSVMLGDGRWARNGGLMAAAGAIIFGWAHRRARR